MFERKRNSMVAACWYLSLLSLMAFVARRRRTTELSRGASEETAHAAVLLKRTQAQAAAHPERRYKTTLSAATAKILGVEKSETSCHIVGIANSGMRIRLTAPVLLGAQVQVQWGDQWFIGTRRNRPFWAGDRSIRLQCVSCSYTRVPWRWRLSSFAGELAYCCKLGL
jgi:hypothetical protein